MIKATAQAVLVIVAAATTSACDVADRLIGAYRGPMPKQEAITNEVAIIRSVQSGPGAVRFLADRVRYLEAGKPHDVNRVVLVVTTAANWEQVSAMALTAGERVTFSSEFLGNTDASDLREVPDWPGHDYLEYPIGQHVLTSIARTSP